MATPSKALSGAAARLLRRHPGANIFVDEHGEVRTDFLVEIFIYQTRQKKISQEGPESPVSLPGTV
jgi:hypothetical protein